MTGEGNRKSCS